MATALSNAIGLTGDPRVDGLLQGSAWQFTGANYVITYSFSLNDTSAGSWDTDLRNAVNRAFIEWSNVANVTFVESGSGTVFSGSTADIAVTPVGTDLQGTGIAALGLFPSPVFADAFLTDSGYSRAEYARPEGDIFFDDTLKAFEPSYVLPGGAGFEILLHEIGHALGLKHSADDGGAGRSTFQQLGLSAYDNTQYTVMAESTADPLSFNHVATPMLFDILAIQRLYGANMSHNTGHDTYPLLSVGQGIYHPRTIWDAGGIDMIEAFDSWSDASIDLRPGAISTGSGGSMIAVAFGTVIENALGGTGNDTLIGNDADNVLDGWTGTNRLVGGLGNDTYHANDTFGLNTIVELPGQGNDTVVSYGHAGYTLPVNVENLSLEGTGVEGAGNDLANVLTGNVWKETLRGLAGDDYLDGRADGDTMYGGQGNDTYVVDRTNVPSVVTRLLMRGTQGDFLLDGSSVAVTPASGSFNITLLDDRRDGVVDGLRLDYSDSASDFHVVYSMSTFSLTGYELRAGAWIAVHQYENDNSGPVRDRPSLDLYGNGRSTTFATSLSSIYIHDLAIDYSSGRPVLARLQSDFQLDPMGTGSQSVSGSIDFNRTLAVVDPDVVIENVNEGIDTVSSSVSYMLPENVENLTLTESSDVDGFGNLLDNIITGNSGNNLLTGGGGNNTLIGGAGLDTAQYSGVMSAYTTTRNGTGYVVRGPHGTDVLTGIERLEFSDALMPLGRRGGDSNADGKTDLVIHNAARGLVQPLVMDGVSWTEAQVYGWDGWKVVSTSGDFDGDGKSDLIIHNAAKGLVQPILMDGVSKTEGLVYGWDGWSVVSASGDFNGDGKSDLVIHNAARGLVQPLLMDGVNWTEARVYGWDGWKVVSASGDFNGDGKSDLLIHNAARGLVQPILMDGVSKTEARVYGWDGWEVVSASSDFNGDGKSDLVIHNAAKGWVQPILMDGVNKTEARVYGWDGWKVVSASGDFNGDGKSDLVLHKPVTGSVQIVLMDGVNWTESREYGWGGWKVLEAQSDFNADGKSDLVLQKPSTGSVQVVLMDGVNWTAARDYGWSGWEVVNSAEGQSVAGLTHAATAGNHTLRGVTGTDRFVYDSVSDGFDTLVGFEFGSWGDTLDLREVLQGYVPGSSNPASFVRLTQSAGDVIVSVNPDGIDSDFVAMVNLQGATGALLNDMLAQGNLVLS